MANPRLAAIQMISGADVDSNLAQAENLIGEAARQGAGLVVLPENFALFKSSDLARVGVKEVDEEGPVRRFLARQAAEKGVWLVGGSIPVLSEDQQAESGRVYATCFVLDPSGKEVGRYEKIHLFDVDVADGVGRYRESDYMVPGNQVKVIGTDMGALGLSICYDLRFPELYAALRRQGARILSVPAAFTEVTGQAHWETLLRARAIETQCYLIAANQGGLHDNNRETYGHSMIIDPWGRVLDQILKGPGVVIADYDEASLDSVRAAMPVEHHRRLS